MFTFLRRWALPFALVACLTAAQDPGLAPPEDEMASEAEGWISSRRIGAVALWGGLIVASIIIGVVRARQRRERQRAEQRS